MGHTESVEIDDDERDALLGSGGTGVISFGTPGESAPHSLPVSYGYDSTDETFYFRLAVPPDSDKLEVLDAPVSFVVHGSTDRRWWSVVATGGLERTTDEDIATETLQGLERVRIPLVDIFGRPPGEVQFEFFRLVPERLTARRESTTPP